MEVNATVDVGNNLTNLIQQLAQQMGIAAEKVFPWYVKQAVLEGWFFFVVLAVLLVVFTPIFIVCLRKTKGEDPWMVGVVVPAIVLFASLIVGSLGSVKAAAKIINPEYAAMQAMTKDIARMRLLGR